MLRFAVWSLLLLKLQHVESDKVASELAAVVNLLGGSNLRFKPTANFRFVEHDISLAPELQLEPSGKSQWRGWKRLGYNSAPQPLVCGSVIERPI